MELAPKKLTDVYLEKPNIKPTKPMSKQSINRLIKDTLQALQVLYFQKIVHADIKPDNILQMEDGRFKLADFGSSIKIDSEDQLSLGIYGTHVYQPPEIQSYLQNNYNQPIDIMKYDTYSLGLTYLAAIIQAKELTKLVYNYSDIENLLHNAQNQNIYDKQVFEIIKPMVHKDQHKRPFPSTLIKMAQKLED